MDDPDLEVLIDGAHVGARVGIEGLYQRFAGTVLTFAMGMLDNEHQALTATERTLLDALRAREDIPDAGHVQGWILRIAAAKCREVAHGAPLRGLAAQSGLSPEERLNGLPPQAREVALLAALGVSDAVAPTEAIEDARRIRRRTPAVSLWASLDRTLTAQRAMQPRTAPRRSVPRLPILAGILVLISSLLLLVILGLRRARL